MLINPCSIEHAIKLAEEHNLEIQTSINGMYIIINEFFQFPIIKGMVSSNFVLVKDRPKYNLEDGGIYRVL